MLVIPAILFSITMVATWVIEGIMLAKALRDEDRATGFGMYSTVSQIPALVAPLLAGLIVTQLGGISVESIRPLFYTNFIVSMLVILWIHWRLEDVKA